MTEKRKSDFPCEFVEKIPKKKLNLKKSKIDRKRNSILFDNSMKLRRI